MCLLSLATGMIELALYPFRMPQRTSDGVAGQNSPCNGLSNGLGRPFLNGLEGPNAIPDGVGGGRSCVNGFPARPGPHE
jgi:hypothetical protein